MKILDIFLESGSGMEYIELPSNVQDWVNKSSARVVDFIKQNRSNAGKPKYQLFDTYIGDGKQISIYVIWDPRYGHFAHFDTRTKDIGINGYRDIIPSEMNDLLTHEMLHAFDPRGDDDVIDASLDRNLSSQREIAAYTGSIINTLKRLIGQYGDEKWRADIKSFLEGGEFPYFAGVLGMNYKPMVDSLSPEKLSIFKNTLIKYIGRELQL